MQHGTRLAAVDLGSNSFRLEIGRVDHGQFLRTEYLKETVRQGNGLDGARNLTAEAMERGWACLARFGERLAGFEPSEVRAVATQTLREARNRDEFLERARAVLGFPIDVISGREEARLIYQGVARCLPPSTERRLVIDIGGRSTELILGRGTVPSLMESYRVGSIAWSTRYFSDNRFSQQAFHLAEIAAKAVLDEALTIYPREAWDIAYGSAGTVGAVDDLLAAAGWPIGRLQREGLNWLKEQLIQAEHADKLRLVGLKDERRAILGGGLSILCALFDLLQINELHHAAGGLRHGLLSDMMGTDPGDHDVRSASIDRLARSFGTDITHGSRVGEVASKLLTRIEQGMHEPLEPSECERLHRKIRWAGQVHEIGTQISHSDYHKHGAYILDNADAMGFTLSELHTLSLLVLGHRGKLRKLDIDFDDGKLVCLMLALRLAVILCHARRDPDLDGIGISLESFSKQIFALTIKADWAKRHPQSAHLLREEVVAWQKTPWTLTLSQT
jgi:exopolyphosphatase / guanosine-5'-triphosphate,3'-diphosphate pyrophosphatase